MRLALWTFGMLALGGIGAGSISYDAPAGMTSAAIDTSSELATILTDETGSGAACFATGPTFATFINVGAAASVADGTTGINLPNAVSVCWESNPAGTDRCETVDASNIHVDTSFQYAGTQDAEYWTYPFYSFAGDTDTGLTRAGANVWGLDAGGTITMTGNASGINFIKLRQADLTSTCTQGDLALDTGGATAELCYCQGTNTWYCAAITDTTGPAD